MAASFLEEISGDIISRYGNDLSGCTFIFPNKRPGSRLKEILIQSGLAEEHLPVTTTIEDFITARCRLTILDSTELIFKLFRIYKRYYQKTLFEEFYSWGRVMLNDFDDIDRHLADADKLFKNISAIREMETYFMEFDNEIADEYLPELNPDDEYYLEEKFKEIWKVYSRCYGDFRKALFADKQAYPGMAYRQVAEQLASGKIPAPGGVCIFAGFNALSKAEESIIDQLIKNNNALIFWDADRYYLDNEREESGHFIRKHIAALQTEQKQHFSDGFLQGAKNIRFIGAPLQVGQAQVLGEELKKHIIDKPGGRKAIVLPDENVLFPVLYALPENCKNPEITIGSSVYNSSYYTLIQSLFSLQENYRARGNAFYYKDVNAVLLNPLVAALYRNEAIAFQKSIIENQWIYVTITDIPVQDNELFALLFQHAESCKQITSYLVSITEYLKSKEASPEAEIFDNVIHDLYNLAESQVFDLSLKTLRRIFTEKCMLHAMPLPSDASSNISIMGMLETRCLDFEDVFILSANEGVLPSKTKSPSYIPFDQRKAFELPTFDEQDYLYAYYFYRLLQRAENVYLIYNSETGSGGEEISRYLRQLSWYLPQANPGITIQNQHFGLPLRTRQAKTITIPKDQAFYEGFAKKNQNGIAPSFISSYFICPLQFTFNHIYKIPQKDEMVEELEAKHFGTLFHAVMENLYEDLKGETVTLAAINHRKQQITLQMDKALDSLHHTQKDFIAQKNSLLVETVKVLAEKALEADAKVAPFTLLKTEEEARHAMLFDDTRFSTINLKGIIDRVDDKEGVKRIVDYKTGAVKRFEFPFRLEETMLEKDNKEAFQTLFYGYIYQAQNPADKMEATVLPLKDVVNGYQIINKGDGPLGKNDFYQFEEKLKQVLKVILDPHQPITQTEDLHICAACSYKNICMR